MSEILAWHVIGAGGRPNTTTTVPAAAAAAREAGHTVTPLVAAPPEGAPTWEELAEELERSLGVLETAEPYLTDSASVSGLVRTALDHVSALLSRIPKDTV